MSDTEINLDSSEVEHLNISTPAKDQRKKRGRKIINFGSFNNIEGIKDNHGVSSEGEHSEGAIKEVKKPRLGEGRNTQEEHNNREILEEENIIAEDQNDFYEKLAQEIVGEKDHTEGLKEDGKIFEVRLDKHEGVPLEDPGPNIEGKDGEDGVAGATQ